MAKSKKNKPKKGVQNQKKGIPKKSKSKRNWGQISLALLIIVLLILVSINPDSFKKSKNNSTNFVEPKFKKEGELSLFKKDSQQEILTIDIEIAENNKERNMGLMYRKKMSEKAGMLFIMEKEKPQSFWMKNTYISLDIIFLDKNLKIVSIQEDTQPLSMQSIPSYKKAKYVLEVVAGFCDKHKIEEGDYINYQRLPIASSVN